MILLYFIEGLNANHAHELSRLIHRFGGAPAGAFIQPHARELLPDAANAMFMDQTHDNPSPIEVNLYFIGKNRCLQKKKH